MNIERAIQDAYQKLKNNNIKSAMLDSELLMANVINKSREFIILNLNKSICKIGFVYKNSTYVIEKNED